MAVYFNGKKRVSPGVFSAIDDSDMIPLRGKNGSVLALVGYADGGEPYKPIYVRSYSEAVKVFKSGDLVLAARAALKPPVESEGPSAIVLVRVSNATQATATLKDDDGNDSIVLRSRDYGSLANLVNISLNAGSLRGYRVTAKWRNDVYSADNVGRSVLKVSYSGSGKATMQVTATELVLAVDGTEVARIGFADHKTVGDVADRINAVADFSATVLENSRQHGTAYMLDGYDGPVTDAGVVVKADLQAILDWLNSDNVPLVYADRASGALLPPAFTNGPVFLSGAENGTTGIEDWQRAIDALEHEDVQWVTPVTADTAVHSIALTHVQFMSEVAGRERRAIFGMGAGTSDEDAIEYAAQLNSDRVGLVHIGYYDYDESGNLVLLPPYMLAAMIAGSFAGLPVGEPLTNKSLQIKGLERRIRNPLYTDKLIEGGVICVDFDGRRYRVVRSVSTWRVDDSYNRVELSTGVALDYVARTVREALENLIGSRATPSLLTQAVSRTDSVLRELSRPAPAGMGLLAGDANNPAFRNITASIDGDVLSVSFECSPIIPLNYGLVTVKATPYSGSVSL